MVKYNFYLFLDIKENMDKDQEEEKIDLKTNFDSGQKTKSRKSIFSNLNLFNGNSKKTTNKKKSGKKIYNN